MSLDSDFETVLADLTALNRWGWTAPPSASDTMYPNMDEPMSTPPVSRMPEYEAAVAQLSYVLVGEMMAALDPVLGQIRRESVDHLPVGSAPGDVAVGFTRGIETRFRFVLDVRALIETDLDAWATMVHDAAEEGLSVVMPQFFAGLDEASQRAGTNVDARGKPFSWDTFLDGIEAVEIDFDDEGKPKMPTLVVSPNNLERIKALPPLDEAQNARFKLIIEKQKAAFDARRRVRRLA